MPAGGERARGLALEGARFLGAGGLATACHYVLLAALVEIGGVPPVAATSAGYAAAALLNYSLRRGFVFRSRAPHRRAGPRYLAVAAGGFGLNGLAVALGTGPLGLPYPVAQPAATVLAAGWNFAAHRLWTFRDPPSPSPPLASPRAGSRVAA